MATSDELWLKLHIAVGATIHSCDLVRYYHGPRELFGLSREELVSSGICSVPLAEKIQKARDTDVSETLGICKQNGWHIITPESEYYPERLREIKDFPLVLFCYGNMELLKNENRISVVGTRKASEKAMMATYLFSACASSLGVVIVSGGALGIDSAAHEGALLGSGGTVCVLGSGFGSDYLIQNEPLRNRIALGGVLITELLPFESPTRYTFPKRNRIISGLSVGILVAESGIKGGSMITADYAIRQNKDVYCFAENIVKSEGTGKLLRQGAKSILVPADVMEDFIYIRPDLPKKDELLNYPLQNNGIPKPHILIPQTMTTEEYATYNGITVEKAAKYLGREMPGTATASKPKKTVPAKANEPTEAPGVPEKEPDGKKQTEEAILAELFPEEVQTKEVLPERVSPEKPKPKRERATRKPKKEKAVPEPPAEPLKKTELPSFLSPNAVLLYGVLEKTPKNFDELQSITQLHIRDVMVGITELELADLAVLHPGNRISL